MSDEEIKRLSNLTTYGELHELKMKYKPYGGFDIADIRAILDEHTRRIVKALSNPPNELTIEAQYRALEFNGTSAIPDSSPVIVY